MGNGHGRMIIWIHSGRMFLMIPTGFSPNPTVEDKVKWSLNTGGYLHH